MKTTTNLFISVIVAILTNSCATPFYQVYTAKPLGEIKTNENLLIYEDNNCKVSYNLWSVGGNIGFSFYNKTDTNIYLNMEECFFILNGIAYDYYRNREYTNKRSSGATTSHAASISKAERSENYFGVLQNSKNQLKNTVGIITSSEYSISYNEKKVICIPSKTSKIITEYKINESLYRNCDLLKYPKKNQVEKISFSKDESPIVFSNRLAYYLGSADMLKKIKNDFYVAEITNYPEGELLELRYKEFCGQKSTTIAKYFKNVSPDKFYIKYTIKNSWKH